MTGPTGAQGEAGPPGAPANVDLSKIGVCYSAPTYDDNTGTQTFIWVSSVDLYPPTDTAGVLSCGTGTYVTLQPITNTGGQ